MKYEFIKYFRSVLRFEGFRPNLLKLKEMVVILSCMGWEIKDENSGVSNQGFVCKTKNENSAPCGIKRRFCQFKAFAMISRLSQRAKKHLDDGEFKTKSL